MSTLSHDDKTPEQPVGGDKIFLRDISDSGTGVNDGIIVSTVNQLGQTIVNDRSAEIKTSYESNADTNAFTDAEQTKLAGIAAGAEVNTVDSVNTQTGAVVLDADDIDDAATTNKFTTAAEISKLAGIAAGAEVNPDVVPQAEAEAGTATTERIWTAERVAQAIAALGGGGGSLTEGNLRAVIAALTAAAPDTADTFGYVDAGSPGQMGQATAQQIVEQGNSDLGITPQNRISTTTDPGTNDDGAGTNGINHLVNDLWTNTTEDRTFICMDVTTGAAVWQPITETVMHGVLDGCVLSVNGGDNTKFDVSAGRIAFVDDTGETPVTTYVDVTAKSAQTVTNIATESATFVFLDSTGAVVQTNAAPTSANRRDYLYLGQLGHSNNTTIANAICEPQIGFGLAQSVQDLWDLVGPINADVAVSANGANLQLDRSAGSIYKYGANYNTDATDPHRVAISSATGLTFRLRTQTGGSGTTTVLDSNNYDVAGTVTALTNNYWQNFRVYQLTSGNTIVMYGQTEYQTESGALAGISSENHTLIDNVEGAALIGFITVQDGETNLSTGATFTSASRFGTGGSGGGGTGDLWSDVVDADIVPDADGTRDLGADATRFAQAYIDELHSTGGLLVTEAADHTNTPAAGKGEYWVRNDAPCVPVFTDDAGTDHVLNAGGGDLWTDPLDSDIIPDTTNTYDLGSAAARFAECHVTTLDVNGNITLLGTLDGRDVATDGAKLDSITPTSKYETVIASDFPDATDDSLGVFALWIHTTDGRAWICVDDTASNAVWLELATGAGDAWGDVVNAVITPDADGTRDLATDATRFATAYVDDVHVTAGVLVTEASDHSNTPAAGKGEFWVKNNAPCTPNFTDDAGNDYVLHDGPGSTYTWVVPFQMSSTQVTYTNYINAGVIPYDGDITEILWASAKTIGADGTNYWDIMPQIAVVGTDRDLLASAYSATAAINIDDDALNLGAIHGTPGVTKGEKLKITFTANGTPPNYFSGWSSLLITMQRT
jgi:hypothetical protein